MKWITALDLDRWAQTNAARGQLPELVGDLIRATSPTIRSFRFPNGDKGQVRGFDGNLDSDGAPPYVPAGTSIWEFGVGGASKALSDYNKRTSQVDPDVRSQATFVFVSPKTWDNPDQKIEEWVSERKTTKEWKDVIYIDGSQLEDWIYQCPGVATKYAREMSVAPQNGAQSCDDFWDEYRFRFKTPIVEEVLIAGRDEQAKQIIQQLMGSEGGIELCADSSDEVIAFAIACIRKSDENTRAYLESKAVVIDSEDAARFMFGRSGLIFIPRGKAESQIGRLASRGPTLIAKGRDRREARHLMLPRPSYADMGKAFELMGIDRDAAYEMARHCGASLTILARQYYMGSPPLPEWSSDAAALLPAVMAGSWDATNDKDTSAIVQLLGTSTYEQLDECLHRVMQLADPPIELHDRIWRIRAPVDAFSFVGGQITADHLSRLEGVASAIFSEPRKVEDPDAPFVLNARRDANYSDWLREGVATTLLQLSVLHAKVGVSVPGIHPPSWVEDLIRSLPGLRESTRLIRSLGSELSLLMEAAPNPLLEALEFMLRGNDPSIQELFVPRGDVLFTPTSPHNYVLWALETLAWDPAYFERAVLVIAGLASQSRGVELSNSPIRSLRSILLAWNPNTFAALNQRLAAVQKVLDNLPEVGWDLLLQLLPKAHDTNVATRKPRLREAGASDAERLLNKHVWAGYDFVIGAVLKASADIPERLFAVAQQLDNWGPDRRGEALQLLEGWLSKRLDGHAVVWRALNDTLARHAAYPDADWALPKRDLEAIQDIVLKYEPKDPIERFKFLFDSRPPKLSVPLDRYDEALAVKRDSAVEEVLREVGTPGLLQLVDLAQEPYGIGVACGRVVNDPQQLVSIVQAAFAVPSGKRSRFVGAASAMGHHRFQLHWRNVVSEVSGLKPSDTAELVASWPDTMETWDFAHKLGSDVERYYWTKKHPFRLEGDLESVQRAITLYISYGRASGAIAAAHDRLKDLDTPTLVLILNELFDELVRDTSPQSDPLLQYHIEETFEEISCRPDVDFLVLAKLEYNFFAFLERKKESLSIYKLIAGDPEFYIGLIRSVYRADDDDEVIVRDSEQAQAKWRRDYELLSGFRQVPGWDGNHFDDDKLVPWVSEVRRLGSAAKRAAITDIHVGQLLAYAPAGSDGNWPHERIRQLIEQIGSDEVDRGVYTERFNQRGVYSKALYEGGAQERELAAKYRRWASAAAAHPRCVRLLNGIAEAYDRDAEREDTRAALDKARG